MSQKSWTFEGKSLAGAGLVVLGLLFLLGNFGFGNLLGRLVGAALFGGLAYLVYREGRRKGNHLLTLLALPLAGIGLASLFPGFGNGAFILAAVGLAFALVWRRNPSRWWAVIVAGALGSMALSVAVPRPFAPMSSALFLLGLAATFFALTRLKVEPQRWAIYPAVALGVLGLLELMGGSGGWIIPLLLVAAGLYLLYRDGRLGTFGRPASPQVEPSPAPVSPPPSAPPGVQVPAAPPTESAATREVIAPAEVHLPTRPAASSAEDAPAGTTSETGPGGAPMPRPEDEPR